MNNQSQEKVKWGTFKHINVEVPANAIKPCLDCQQIMEKKLANGITLDSNPPMHGWDWVCSGCGAKQNGGWESDGEYFLPLYLKP